MSPAGAARPEDDPAGPVAVADPPLRRAAGWAAAMGGGLLRALYPPQCLACGGAVAAEFGLCPTCWRDTPFIEGLVCDACGHPLPGEAEEAVHCDDCLARPPGWARGRAAMLYGGQGRALVLGLKHADGLDTVRPAGRWMARAAGPILLPGMLVAPVPLHRWRLMRRRYNQAALLGRQVARAAGLDFCPDLLIRPRSTGSQEGRDRAARQAALAGALAVHPRRRAGLEGRPVLVVDDVMTSGATLSAAAQALGAAGAGPVHVLVLARAPLRAPPRQAESGEE